MIRPLLLLLVLSVAATGCMGPDYNAIANRLRKANMDQQKQISALNQKIANRDAAVADLQAKISSSTPAPQTLPPDRLAQLFTAARMEIRPQTNTNDPGEGHGINGFRVMIRFFTDDDDIIPAAGTLVIEAFELPDAPTEPRRVGTWTFTPADLKKNWYTAFGANYFALNCPWSAPPTLATITFKAHFTDALTGRTLAAELNKKVVLPIK